MYLGQLCQCKFRIRFNELNQPLSKAQLLTLQKLTVRSAIQLLQSTRITSLSSIFRDHVRISLYEEPTTLHNQSSHGRLRATAQVYGLSAVID